MPILTEAVGLVNEVVGIFKGFQPTPEEQQAKAGVWYRMLQDLVTNDRSGQDLARIWESQYPFKQKRTKQGFSASLLGKTQNQLIDMLVQKINDELVKGGFSSVSRSDVLSGMGVADLGSSKVGSGVVNAGAGVLPGIDPFADSDVNAQESQIYFVVLGIVVLIAGVVAFLFYNPKKRR